jgi:L-rhamnose mutarotase
MKLHDKSDKEILELAQPIWDNLVKSSNIKDYGGFTKDFSSQMLYGANEVELGKQWANNKLLTSLSEKQDFLGTIRRGQ